MEVMYRCSSCRHRFPVAITPSQAEPKPRDYPRCRCPQCRAASALEYWLEKALEDAEVNAEFYRRWSNCPNATVCSGYDQYASDCENGQLKPKCLVALHEEIQSLHARLPVAKPKRVRREKPAATPEPNT